MKTADILAAQGKAERRKLEEIPFFDPAFIESFPYGRSCILMLALIAYVSGLLVMRPWTIGPSDKEFFFAAWVGGVILGLPGLLLVASYLIDGVFKLVDLSFRFARRELQIRKLFLVLPALGFVCVTVGAILWKRPDTDLYGYVLFFVAGGFFYGFILFVWRWNWLLRKEANSEGRVAR